MERGEGGEEDLIRTRKHCHGMLKHKWELLFYGCSLFISLSQYGQAARAFFVSLIIRPS